MKIKTKLFAWSVLRMKWFQVLNIFGRPTFMPSSADAIGPNDIAITMPTGVVSRPTQRKSPSARTVHR